MQLDTTRILGDWVTLSDQLDRTGTISRWVAAEPVFTGLRRRDLTITALRSAADAFLAVA